MTTILLSHGGSDTVNIGTHAYYRRDDGAFHLDDTDAASLLSANNCGFGVAPPDYVSPIAPPESLVLSLIRAMKPSETKTALGIALTSLKLKAIMAGSKRPFLTWGRLAGLFLSPFP
jgi:hypothetical protein